MYIIIKLYSILFDNNIVIIYYYMYNFKIYLILYDIFNLIALIDIKFMMIYLEFLIFN